MYLGECMEIKTPSPRGQSRSIVVGPFFFFLPVVAGRLIDCSAVSRVGRRLPMSEATLADADGCERSAD